MSAHSHTKVVQSTPVEPPTIDPRRVDEPMINNLAHGIAPSNEQVNLAINHARDTIEDQRHHADINRKGDQLARDTEDVLDSAQRFLNEHNQHGRLQDLYQHTKEASLEASKEAARVGASVSGASHLLPSLLTPGQKIGMARDARHGMNYGRDLMMYVIQSSEFKALLIEAIDFFQNVLLDGSERISQLGEHLKQDIINDDTHIVSTRMDAHSVKEEVKGVARSKAMEWNEPRRHEVYERFRMLMERASRQPEFRNLVNIFFKWMDQLRRRALLTKDRIQTRVEVKVDQVRERIHDAEIDQTPFDKVLADVRAIVDEFAGQGSWDQFYQTTWNLYVELVHDDEASAYFENLRHFVTDFMEHPEHINVEASTQEGHRLMDQGRTIIQSQKYRVKFESMFDNTRFLLIKIKNDESTVAFKESLKKWGEHFALDSQGRPDLYVIQESLVQLKNLAYPVLREKLGHLKIARVVGSTDKVDYAIEDLVVSVPDLLPRTFELQTKTDLQVDFEDLQSRNGYVKASLDLRKLKPVFKNVKFWYKKKTFPKMEDHGIVDVDLSAGEGTRVKIVWKIVTEPHSNPAHPFSFSLVNVKCTVDKMDIEIRDAKHSVLDKIATSLFVGKMKSSVAQAIVDGIVGALQPINNQMNQWFATRPAHSIKDRANDAFHDAFDRTNAAIKDHPVDKLKDRASNAVDVAKIGAVAAKETIKVRAEDMAVAAKETFVDVKSEVQAASSSASEAMSSEGTYGTASTPVTVNSSTTTTTYTETVPEYVNKDWHFEWYSAPASTKSVKIVESFPVSTTTVSSTIPMADSAAAQPL